MISITSFPLSGLRRGNNDFARWVSQALREEALAEKLAAIDLLTFTTIRELRDAVIGTVDEHLGALDRPGYECRPAEAFHFCRSRSFVLPTEGVQEGVEYLPGGVFVQVLRVFFQIFHDDAL